MRRIVASATTQARRAAAGMLAACVNAKREIRSTQEATTAATSYQASRIPRQGSQIHSTQRWRILSDSAHFPSALSETILQRYQISTGTKACDCQSAITQWTRQNQKWQMIPLVRRQVRSPKCRRGLLWARREDSGRESRSEMQGLGRPIYGGGGGQNHFVDTAGKYEED